MSMKKKMAQLSAGALLLAFISLTYLTCLACLAWKERQRTKPGAVQLPSVTLKTLQDIEITLTSYPAGTAKIVVLFDSSCPSCRAQGLAISSNMDFLKGVQVYFLSTESLETIATFRKHLGFDSCNNVRFLQISDQEAHRHFGSGYLPQIYIYAKNGLLLKFFRGETKITTLVSCINRENVQF